MPPKQRQVPPLFGSVQVAVHMSPVAAPAGQAIGVCRTVQAQVSPPAVPAPAAPPPGPPKLGAQKQRSVPVDVVYEQDWPIGSGVHASPGVPIMVTAGAVAGQPAGFMIVPPPVPPVAVPVPPVPPVVVPVPPVVVPVPPVVVPVPPFDENVPPLPVLLPVPSPPPVDEDVPPVDDDDPPLEPDVVSLEPPHEAVSAKPPTSIKPKAYFRAFMDSSSGAGVKLGPKLAVA